MSLTQILEVLSSTIEKYGADSVRFYLMNIGPVWSPIKFDHKALDEVVSKFYNTLKNTYNFFEMYANTDEIDPRKFDVSYDELEEIDKWLLSKYNNLVKNVTDAYEEYDLNKAAKLIVPFLNDDLSNWYIRRNRRRFWASKLDNSKKAVYKTTYDVLIGFLKLVSPITPFITDDIYTKLTGEESIHLSDFPEFDASKVNEKIENRMDLVKDLISLGRNAREEAKIKVRQPINEVILDGKNEELISDLTPLIKEELNVKNVTFVSDLTKYMSLSLKPNFRVCGRMFGKNINEYSKALENLDETNISKLQKGEDITIKFMDEDLTINQDMIEIRVSSKEGYDAAFLNDNFIVIDTTLTDELINEGIARELVSKVQNIRKDSGLDISDRITLFYNGDIDSVISSYEEYIKDEVLALDIVKSDSLENEYDLNGKLVKIKVEKVVK